MSNSYSTKLLAEFLSSFSKLSWQPLDNNKKNKPQGESVADYQINHAQLGVSIIELKEIKDAEPFQEQQKISNEIKKQLEGLFVTAAFSYRFDSDDMPDHKNLAEFRKFLATFKEKILFPCRIVFPKNSSYPLNKLIEIQRLDSNEKIIERLYSPATSSDRYPRGDRSIENSRRLKDPCIIIDGEKALRTEERGIFHESERPYLSMVSTHGKGGSVFNIQGIGGWLSESDRIRDNIGKSNRQLKPYSHLNCPLGFVTCPSGFQFASFDDLVEAIIGEYQIEVNVSKDGNSSERPIHGGKRTLQPHKNTTISYCGWLDLEGRQPIFKIIHNDFSKSLLPFEFFDAPYVEQFSMKYRIGSDKIIGDFEQITSAQELSGIRTSNKAAIRLMKPGQAR